jgi:hypothetical protein
MNDGATRAMRRTKGITGRARIENIVYKCGRSDNRPTK